ncbi:MAG: reverse transcriptase/maturase family protein [Planctomycetota bacterium]
MGKRTRVTLEDVAGWDHLAAAFWRAARGKRDRPEVMRFERQLRLELRRLREDILDGSGPLGTYQTFMIHDPKRRTIHAPAFRDRVLHHALAAKIGPALDRALVDDTYACRPGKGTLAAVQRAQDLLRRHPWLIQTDVVRFFDSVHHGVLREVLERRLKGSVLALCGRVLSGYESEPQRGLPIGALTSQYFANSYLGGLDRLLSEELRVRGMVRYMDDLVWWCSSRREAVDALNRVSAYVGTSLALRLRPKVRLQRSAAGLSFCGFRIRRGTLRLSRRRCRRYVAARQRWELSFREGWIEAGELQAGYASAWATTQHADARNFRRADLLRHAPPEI